MACLARPVALAALATTLTVVRLGLADDGGWFDPPAGPTQPPPHGNGPPPDLPPHVVPQPNGGVIVHRTPEEGVDVDAPTPSGRVRAYGCGRVEVDPSDVAPPGPPPCAVPTPPPSGYGSYRYPTYPGPHYPGYGPPSGGSYSYPYAAPYGRKPREPSDPARRAALVTSSLLFGLGTVGAGSAFVVSVAIDKPSEPALYTLGGVLTLSPSLPREDHIFVDDVEEVVRQHARGDLLGDHDAPRARAPPGDGRDHRRIRRGQDDAADACSSGSRSRRRAHLGRRRGHRPRSTTTR
jgi:hypothetical protein